MILLAAGCAHSKGSRSGEGREPIAEYRILETVRQGEEAASVSLVTFMEDGRYLWVVRDVWSNPVRNYTFSGELPLPMIAQLKSESAAFQKSEEGLVFILRQDQSQQVPVGVQAIMQELKRRHFAAP